MSYLVFARKWRPKNFDEVIGQEHISTTLKNAISLKRVGHAYLFSGPRGIGKTSTARILAKALNCAQGSVPTPCNACENCREISENRSLDVIEIDGASNRGIEQIRQLRQNVKFAAAKSRFKVYIIDEVHQITTDGFNALLKTLEEPPAHVKFIFATTQAHKVLPTILSRCQRFDFRPLSVALIVEKLKRIIKAEKLAVSAEAVVYIAHQAAGSMRDAESILDQLSSYSGGEVKLDTVTSVLGMVGLQALEEISQKIIARQGPEALTLTEKIINEGKDLSQFIGGLMDHFRNILITKVVNSRDAQHLIDLPTEYIMRISEQGKSLSLEETLYIINVLARAQESLKRTLSSRVIVEMAIIKLTQRENLSSLENILTRLTNLERSLGETEPQAQGNSESLAQEVPAAAEPVPAEAASEEAASTEPASAEPTSDELNHSWSHLLEAIKEEKMFVASSLEMGQMGGIKGKVLTVAFPKKYNFYKETLERPENKQLIETKAKEVFRRQVKVKFVLDENLKTPSAKEEEILAQDSVKNTAAEPIIQSALKIFQGRFTKRNTD